MCKMKYDVVVVGGGHAGCEAGLASARLGMNTIIFPNVKIGNNTIAGQMELASLIEKKLK